jgi:hypothetical protein
VLTASGAVAVYKPGCVDVLDAVLPVGVAPPTKASTAVPWLGRAVPPPAPPAPLARVGSSRRRTKETVIEATVALDGEGRSEVSTGIGFLDHMLAAFSKHSHIDVQLTCKVRTCARERGGGRLPVGCCSYLGRGGGWMCSLGEGWGWGGGVGGGPHANPRVHTHAPTRWRTHHPPAPTTCRPSSLFPAGYCVRGLSVHIL